jgi:hypothetical protein
MGKAKNRKNRSLAAAFHRNWALGLPFIFGETELTPTAGERLPDESLIELVKESSESREVVLQHRAGKHTTTSRQIDHAGKHYIPIKMNPGLVQQLRLPTENLPYGSTAELVNQISSILMQVSGLSAVDAFLCAVFAIASCFADFLPIQLCLWLLGFANAEARSLLRVLNWVCWHPLLQVDDKGMDDLPQNLTVTRLFYAPRPSAKLRKLISNSNALDFAVFRAGSLREHRGAIAVYPGLLDLDGDWEDTCLRISVVPGTRLLGPGDEERYRAAVDEVRGKLFNYRLAHYEEVLTSEFDVSDLTGSTRQIAQGLGACLVNAADLRDRLIAILRDQDESERAEQSAEMSPVLEALIVVCHERRKDVHVGEIAKLASEILEVRGERIGLSPKEVGSKLKSLGLRTCRLDAGGRGFKLTQEICARIHGAAKAFRVPAIENGLEACPHCRTIRGDVI